jgi:hypothetical protein
LPLPPIIPLVFYHGARRWNAAETFHGLFDGLDDEFRPLTIQFGYVLIDLGRIDDDSLSRDLRQRAMLTALKYTPRPDMREVGLKRVVRQFAGLSEVDIILILRYILDRHGDIGKDDVNRALLEGAPERRDEIMNVWIREIGEEHFARGEAKGKAETLLKQLSHRFGRLPQEAEQRIRKADPETLDRWILRILDAKSLAEVMAN